VSDEIKALIEKQGKAFEEFKTSNDAMQAEIKKMGAADVVTADKVEKLGADLTALSKEIKAQLVEIEKKANRPDLGTGTLTADQAEHKTAFGKFLRKGAEDGLRDLEKKALRVGSDADGGYALPEPGEIVRFVDTAGMRRVGLAVGVSGDQVEIADGILMVNGVPSILAEELGIAVSGRVELTFVDPGSIMIVMIRLGAIERVEQVPVSEIVGKVHKLL